MAVAQRHATSAGNKFTHWWRQFFYQWQLQIMVLPGIIFMIIFNFIPIYGLVLAFKNYTVVDTIDDAPWVGLTNFKIIAGDSYFWDSVVNTLGISAIKLILGFILPIILAVMIHELPWKPFQKIVQTITYLPHFFSWIILGGMIISWLSSNGLLNQTLRHVHQDGNISDDSFTDDGDTFKEKESKGQYASIFLNGFVGHSTQLQQWASAHPESQYVAVDGIRSTQGHKPTLSEAGLSGWTISYITKQCKNPAKAIQTFTYLLSDYGEMLVNFGIEGKTYTKNADGTVSWTPSANKVRLNDSQKWQQNYRMGEFVLFGHDRYKALNKDSFTDAIRQFQSHNQKYLKPEYEIENIAPDVGTLEARSYSTITTKWSSVLVSLIRARSDQQFDKIVRSYKKFLRDNNIDAINRVRNEKIARNERLLKQ